MHSRPEVDHCADESQRREPGRHNVIKERLSAWDEKLPRATDGMAAAISQGLSWFELFLNNDAVCARHESEFEAALA